MKNFKKSDIFIHYVIDDEITDKTSDYPDVCVNIHTHGMEKYGAKNFCLVANYTPQYAQWLLMAACKAYIEDGMDIDKIQAFDTPDGNGGGDGIYHTMFFLSLVECCGEECYLIIPCDKDGIPLHSPNMFPERWKSVDIKLIEN